ncbi:uncharacterized protein [Nicotiana sylvestris]|uniref:uncharacterized protein n=1 Tax=Nicotiana sylvestris TaxID=4096 RepID=UPI00388C390D
MKKLEILIRNLEDDAIAYNNHENRLNLSKARAEYTRFLKLQDNVLRQKARVKWLEEGDTNTAFFHGVIKDRRKRVITDEENAFLNAIPTLQEIKDSVFSIDPDSVFSTKLHGLSLVRIFIKLLTKVLPRIISQNQSGFVKGRAITENILLTQEIVHDIGKPMWGGFAESWIDLIHRYISNNWYTLIVNGSRHGFFKSGTGLRQGDTLFPLSFVLSAELLSKMLNVIQENRNYKNFSMNRHVPIINHLAFADDTIIFSSGNKASLHLILNTLATYERDSGQLINREQK